MSIVKLCVGVPACGKSTLADQLHDQGWAIVERDRIRFETYGKWYGVDEKAVTAMHFQKLGRLIQSGFNIVVSDTNINPETRNGLIKFAEDRGASVELEFVGKELFFEELVRRNNSQDRIDVGKVVPMQVMQSFYASYREQFPLMAVNDPRLPPAFLFDIDGTLAEMNGRGPFEWKKVIHDTTHDDVIEMAQILSEAGFEIIVMSGRDEVCRNETIYWLQKHKVPYDELFMRPAGSHLKDSAVKHDLYHQYVAGNWNVRGVFDDRNQVVDQWRRMGIRCYQVQPGNF